MDTGAVHIPGASRKVTVWMAFIQLLYPPSLSNEALSLLLDVSFKKTHEFSSGPQRQREVCMLPFAPWG